MEPMKMEIDEDELPDLSTLLRRRGSSFQTAIALTDNEDEVIEVSRREVKKKTKLGGMRQAPIKVDPANIIEIDW